MTQRVYPVNTEAEKACLGACFNHELAMEIVVDSLDDNHFYDPRNKQIFRVLNNFYTAGDRPDFDLILKHLDSAGLLERCGGFEYLDNMRLTYRSVEVKYYTSELHAALRERNLIELGRQLISEDNLSSDERMHKANEMLANIGSTGSQAKPLAYHLSNRGDGMSALDFYMKRKKDFDSGKRTLLGIPTGWAKLDDALEGLIKKELIVIGARPSMGKSEVIIQMIISMVRKGLKIMLFSFEMTPDQITDRICGIMTGIRAARLRGGKFSDQEEAILAEKWPSVVEIEKSLIIDDNPCLTAMDIQARTRRAQSTDGIDAVFVDLLGKIKPINQQANLYQTTTEAVGAMKRMAQQLDIPVVLAAQLGRGAAKSAQSTGSRPTMADFRDSGAVEQDADIAILIHRPDYYDSTDKPGLVELIVDKSREGMRGPIRMMFDWKTQRMTEYEDVECFMDGKEEESNVPFFS